MRQSWNERSPEELLRLLDDPDQRIRLEAQYSLAERAEVATLLQATEPQRSLLARLHGVWGIGQLGQRDADMMASLLPLLNDSQPEVRAQVAKVLGDGALLDIAFEPLVKSLSDSEPRVQAFAAISLAAYGDIRSMDGVIRMIAQHQDADPIIRHAGTLVLAGLQNSEPIIGLRTHTAVSVRRAAAVALRRLQHPRVSEFLDDTDLTVAVEAARAIYDDQIVGAREALAAQLARPITGDVSAEIADAFYRRAIFANLALGTPAAAQRVAHFAAEPSVTPVLQQQAILALRIWQDPPLLDSVTGEYRPSAPRNRPAIAEMMGPRVEQLLNSSQRMNAPMVELAAVYGVAGAEERLRMILRDQSQDPSSQAAALEAVSQLRLEGWAALVDQGLASEHPPVRMAAQRILARTSPRTALPAIVKSLEEGTTPERQQAVRLLGRMRGRQAEPPLLAQVQRLGSHDPPPAAVQLDLIEVAQERAERNAAFSDALAQYGAQLAADDPLAKYRVCLEGGDALRGLAVFAGRSELSCRRCHNIEGDLVSVGPNLTHVARENSREYLLESIVLPNKKISKGFETTIVITLDGKTYAGIVREENEESLLLILADGQLQRIAKADVDERVSGKSAMPEDLLKQLSLSDLRDLVEFLSILK